jgi:hypothetical protein
MCYLSHQDARSRSIPLLFGTIIFYPGPVVRVGPEKVVCDIEAMYRISGARSGYIKSDWDSISRVSRDSDHVLSMRESKLRKK